MSGRGFWNFIGLPNVDDIQALSHQLQIQRDYLQESREIVEQKLQSQKEYLQMLNKALERVLHTQLEMGTEIQKLMEGLDLDRKQLELWRTIQDKIEDCQVELGKQLTGIRTEMTGQQNILRRQEEATYTRLNECAKNQDELLRILIVNSLNDTISSYLPQEENKQFQE